MKKLYELLLSIFNSIDNNKKEMNFSDLKEDNGVFYEKKTQKPFNGVAKFYYDNKKLRGKGSFKNGLLDGISKTYYENGRLEGEANWKNGIQDGTRKCYHKNGKLKSDENFKNGVQDGVNKYYYEDGKLSMESNYKNGKLVGDRNVFL